MEIVENDLLFLLSAREARALSQKILEFDNWWWLRSPGDGCFYAAYVDSDGSVSVFGNYVSDDNIAVRPALRFESFISKSSNLKLGDKITITFKDEAIYTATVINSEKCIALFDKEINYMSFNGDIGKYNDYETSDVRNYLLALAKLINSVTPLKIVTQKSQNVRSFEFARKIENKTVVSDKAFESARLPEYATTKSAGADFFCAKATTIKPNCIGLVHTGIKANMNENEVLLLYNRSSNPKKLGLMLANSVGVIDADYYNNEDNDGEIMFAFYNFSDNTVRLEVGDKLGQGVFSTFNRPEQGLVVKDTDRTGGFGSTDLKR